MGVWKTQRQSHFVQPLLHPPKIFRDMLTIDKCMVGMKRVGDFLMPTVPDHFAEGQQWNTALPLGHHGVLK